MSVSDGKWFRDVHYVCNAPLVSENDNQLAGRFRVDNLPTRPTGISTLYHIIGGEVVR